MRGFGQQWPAHRCMIFRAFLKKVRTCVSRYGGTALYMGKREFASHFVYVGCARPHLERATVAVRTAPPVPGASWRPVGCFAPRGSCHCQRRSIAFPLIGAGTLGKDAFLPIRHRRVAPRRIRRGRLGGATGESVRSPLNPICVRTRPASPVSASASAASAGGPPTSGSADGTFRAAAVEPLVERALPVFPVAALAMS